MRKRASLIAALFLAAFALAACAAPAARTPDPAQPTPPAQAEPTPAPQEDATVQTPASSLAGTKWNLSQIDGAAPVAGESPASIEFEADRLAGSTGCNRFFGGYTATASTLTVSQTGSTMMACPEPVMDQEMSFLAILGAAAVYTIEDTTLTIATSDGRTMVFTQA